MGCSLTLVILLQVYIMLAYRTSQGLYPSPAAFVQRLHLTGSSSPLNYATGVILQLQNGASS